jgi:hypothetical protein
LLLLQPNLLHRCKIVVQGVAQSEAVEPVEKRKSQSAGNVTGQVLNCSMEGCWEAYWPRHTFIDNNSATLHQAVLLKKLIVITLLHLFQRPAQNILPVLKLAEVDWPHQVVLLLLTGLWHLTMDHHSCLVDS